MQRGPLPPHERTWRHPSELAAEERAFVLTQASPRGTRALALATGTMGLLAVGLLVLTVTPKRAESPIAISASTNPVAVHVPLRQAIALAPGRSNVGDGGTIIALATPIGDGRFALVTRASLAGTTRSKLSVLLPSGRRSAGEIVTASDDAVVVALSDAEPGHTVARHRPLDHDLVTVMSTPPINVSYADVDTLDVAEGTPVLDGNGDLVGICSQRDGSEYVRLIEVIVALDEATSVVP